MAEQTKSEAAQDWKDQSYLGKFKLEKRGNGEIYVPTKLAEKLAEMGWGSGSELEFAVSTGARGELYLRVYKK